MIYSKNPPEDYRDSNDDGFEGNDSPAILIIAVIGCILGSIFLFLLLSWLFCLFQARLKDSRNSAVKKLFAVRSYIGCLPRCKGPHAIIGKERDCVMKPCWFTACPCCCQELKAHECFLDEKLSIPVSLLQANTIQRQLTTSSTSQTSRPPKMSILAPDSIVVPTSMAQSDNVPAGERVESMDFYSYRLHGLGYDKIMY